MLVKIIGAALLLGLTVYVALEFSLMEGRRLRQIEGFLLLLRHIKAQISCFCMPTADIYRGFSNESLEESGLLASLCETNEFAKSIKDCRERLYLEDEEINLMLAFGGELGKSYRGEQIDCCDYYISEFESTYSARREEHPRRTRLMRSLLLSGGLMVIIIFI